MTAARDTRTRFATGLTGEARRARIRAAMPLYAVTDPSIGGPGEVLCAVEQALCGGATFVQLRDKEADDAKLLPLARALAHLCGSFGVPFVVNDRVELAAACGADGVHVGQSDASYAEARKLLGSDAIVGVSASNFDEAAAAAEAGADYLGVGALFSTPTKPDAVVMDAGEVMRIARELDVPTVGIGGVNLERVAEVTRMGLDGVAVVSALFTGDVYDNACELARAYRLRA